jgi:hypothetical protein
MTIPLMALLIMIILITLNTDEIINHDINYN